jgi:hypothetical protein
MINSVGEYVAGEEYELDDETADSFILKGYAEGNLSRSYSEQERDALTNGHQVVSA